MEKYYIVTPSSPVYKQYLDYVEMSEKVNNAFKEFAEEHGIETSEYYQMVDELRICPTDTDKDKFKEFFKKHEDGWFKKNSKIAKEWIDKCKELELKTPYKPRIAFVISFSGKSSSRLFMINDVLYASFCTDCDFENPDEFDEMRGSEFFKIIEEYEDSLKNSTEN
ncbi:MAG: hypothetical protein PHV18_05230 [Lachnospiraceae bacterium]|nr:hypothetical protein [Lachnospiraceae bacterium]